MSRSSSKLTEAQRLALMSLLGGSSSTEAAEVAGVARETVSRWRSRNPDFIAEYNDRRAAAWESGMANLHALLDKATSALGDLLGNYDTPASIRLQAASLVLKTLRVPELARAPDVDAPRTSRAVSDAMAAEDRRQARVGHEDALIEDALRDLEKVLSENLKKTAV
ncbi:MAG: hypothetical protein AAF355_03690 [Myxococcota bacterium]